jgi:hypothetical protein
MTLNMIVYVAQMLTAIATLAVAFVLVYQLRLQHSEAQRQLVLSINEQRQYLALALARDPDLSSINSRGGADYGDLNQSERIRFNRIFQAEMNLSNIAQEYSDLLHVDPDQQLRTNFALFPGRRKFYKEGIIRFTLPAPFVAKVDRYIREIELKVGEDGQDLSVLDPDNDTP